MGAALVILVLVASGERTDASTRAVAPALEHAARRPVSIALRESVSDLDPARLARLAADGRADVIVELGWRTPQHDHVTIQLHARDGQQLRASELDFVGSAPRPERGRAVGFAIATMLDDEPIAASILAATSLPVSVVAATPAETPEPPAEPAQPAMTSAPAREPDRASAPPPAGSRFAVEGAGSAIADARGQALGAGPRVRFQWNVTERVGLRLGAAAQWFSVGGRAASELGAGVGVLWTFAQGRSLAAAARAEVGVVRDAYTETVTRTNPRGMSLPAENVSQEGVAPSVLAGLEADWRAGRTLATYVAVDLGASTRELTASATRPSPVWLGLEGGVRISF